MEMVNTFISQQEIVLFLISFLMYPERIMVSTCNLRGVHSANVLSDSLYEAQ